MYLSVITIGNSKGIRIPNAILKQYNIKDGLELTTAKKEIILKPIQNRPRQNWNQEFKKMRNNKEDKLIFPENHKISQFEWEW